MSNDGEGGIPMLGDLLQIMLNRVAGKEVEKSITLSANASSEKINVFKINGIVRIEKLWALVTDATTMSNCTNVHFDVCDGASSFKITNDMAILSNAPVGTRFWKTGVASENIGIIKTDKANMIESASSPKVYWECKVAQKNSTDTYLRFCYNTTDTPINATITIFARYFPEDGGSLEVV